ncbi:MAG: hypothetical protein WBJ50_04665 [Smithellaceae bacterium]
MMTCSLDDKRAGTEVWRKFSGQVTAPEQWNDKAVQALVNLVADTRKCSANMNYVPLPTIVPSKSWFFKQALRPLKDWLQRGTATFETCKTGKYWQHKNIIETELQIGE